MVDFAISALTEVLTLAVPVAIVFEVGNIVVGTFLRVAFGGRLWFGK